jgi:hypothetical protein
MIAINKIAARISIFFFDMETLPKLSLIRGNKREILGALLTFCSAIAKNLASFPEKPKEATAVTKPPIR